jgi:hypothetical protein
MNRSLAALLRLRRLEVEAARRTVAEAAGAEIAAEHRLVKAREAPRAEAALVAPDALAELESFTAWLPHAAASVQAAAAALQAASRTVAMARTALGDSQAACKAVETLQEQAALQARKQQVRREAHLLDDAIRSRRG